MNAIFWSAGVAAITLALSRGDLDEAIRQGALAGPVAIEKALLSNVRLTQLAAVAAAPVVEDRAELLPSLARVAAGRDRRIAIPAARAALAIASELAGNELADDLAPGDLRLWRALFEAIAFSGEHPIEVRVAALETCRALAQFRAPSWHSRASAKRPMEGGPLSSQQVGFDATAAARDPDPAFRAIAAELALPMDAQ